MAKFKYKARDPMEIAITVPDIIRRDLFPAWPTRLIDTERNIDILPCHIKIPFVSSISFYYRWSKVVQIKLIGLLLLNLQVEFLKTPPRILGISYFEHQIPIEHLFSAFPGL